MDAISVVKPGRCKVHVSNLVLDDVLRVNGQLEGLGLGLRDGFLETRDPFIVLGWHDQEISLACDEHPLLVLADIYCLNGLTEAGKKTFSILAHLLVHSDISVGTSDNEATVNTRCNRVEERIRLIDFRYRQSIVAQARINRMQTLRLTADQGTRDTLLAVLYVIVDLSEFNLLLASLNLLHDFA